MFKDYYSILGISFPSNEKEIQNAYQSKIDLLGEESTNTTNPNYLLRIDVEEAYRMLKSKYMTKNPYDEEYLLYLNSDDKDNYEIQDEWTKSQMNSEREFVIKQLALKKPIKEEKKGIFIKVISCLGKVLGVCLLILVITISKKCSRSIVKENLSNSVTETINYELLSESEAEKILQSNINEYNKDLPQEIDNNLTFYAFVISKSYVTYDYVVDDNYFYIKQSDFLSKDAQIKRIKERSSEMKPMIDLLLKTNRGIAYNFICKKSGITNVVEITNSELKKIMK